MRKDHRPYWIKQMLATGNRWYVERFIRPQFEFLGRAPMIVKPRSLHIFGQGIGAGDFLHIISHPTQPVKFTSWSSKTEQGNIRLGHHCLISPGVEITSACNIQIGDNTMIGAGSLIHDCDWHGLYNRLRPFRCSQPVHLGENVWVGTRCLIFKGVSIGENSVIGAGSVVTHDIPANVVAAGNPAQIVKPLNPKRRMLKREFLFRQGADYWQQQQLVHQYLAADNTFANWIKTLWAPTEKD